MKNEAYVPMGRLAGSLNPTDDKFQIIYILKTNIKNSTGIEKLIFILEEV